MKQFCLSFVAIGLTLPASGQGADPVIGTWRLNVEKSTYVGTSAQKVKAILSPGKGKL